jgi:Ran GTPase-activating protein (RanGAP) involved in mRNA processing and transport
LLAQNISLEKLAELGEALKTNTVLENLSLANTRATETVAKAIAEGLRENKTLQTLNVESNYISGKGIVALLEAMNVNQTLTELRVTNQVRA